MREYRVWNEKLNKYVNDTYLNQDGKLFYHHAGTLWPLKNCVVEWGAGLYDKYDKMIFERDVVEFKIYRGKTYKEEVVFARGGFVVGGWWLSSAFDNSSYGLKVIGNIHEDKQ